MNRPLRLGPLAILLLVISIVMSTMSILTYTTARADMILTERYADTVEIRNELELEGNKFLSDIHNSSTAINSYNTKYADGIYVYTVSKDGYVLTVKVTEDNYSLVHWEIHREWEHGDTIDDLWDGR